MSKIDKDRVWDKAKIIDGKNPNLYREDSYGNTIFYDSYGKTSQMGWEVDHLKPLSKGGTDHINNLSATQWRKNRQKSDKYPYKKS